MNRNRLIVGIAVTALSALAAADLLAQAATSGVDPARAAHEQELAAIAADRGRVVQEIVERWASQLKPANPALNDDGGFAALAGALSSAAPEALLAASRAESYEEVVALIGARRQPTIVALEPGQPIPNTLGSTSGDLVFTPITPCRIVDTRVATGGWAGKIGPGAGNWFSVNLANFTSQGGAASCAGMPTTFNPGGVAINVTSTGQTGPGNLRVVACGAGNPLVSLLNYTPGVSIANAAAVSSAVGTCSLGPPAGAGPNDIFVFSSNSASDVVVDIMGYYAPPEATALDVTTVTDSASIAAGANSLVSVTCPAGRTATGGGCNFASFSSPLYFISSNALGNGWNCAVQNRGASADILTAYVRCARVPGR